MKKLGLLLVAVIFGTAMSMAQPGGGGFNMDPEQMAERQTAQIKEAVSDLTADQETKIHDLVVETSKKQSEMFQEMQNGGGDMTAMREKMTELRDEQTKKIKEILTEDQFAEYEEFQNSNQRGFGGGRPPGM